MRVAGVEMRIGDTTYDQIIRGGMEGYECAVGRSAADNYAVDTLFPRDYGMDETYDYDFFETDGRKGRRLL